MFKTLQLAQIALLLLFCSFSYSGFAQATGASLTGEVTDAAGAAIPGASVTVKNIGTNLTDAATSNGQGVYRIAPLPPGTYALTVARKGFSTYVQEGIILTVALSATQNVTLNPGSTTQTVQVTANAELINTTSASLGMTVNSTAITQLPLNGRDPQSLVFLAAGITNGTNEPGVAFNQAGFAFPGETGASSGVGGGRAGSAYYLLDGAPNQDNYLGLAAPFPNADATQEFRVITNNFNAAYGFSPGAVVTIETKSGTNAFHGGVWEFLRNQSFNASNWFSHAVDPLHQNQFGGDLGGPILKNRLFFFANYQGTRNSTASTSNFVYSLTPAMLKGDFSGVPQTLNAPFATINGKPNQINPALFNSNAVEIAKTALPVGQQPNGGVFFESGRVVNDENEGTGRIDYTISPSQRIFARTYINYLEQPADGIPGNILTYVYANRLEDYNGVLGHTWTINPKMVNVATAFLNQIDTHQAGQGLLSNGKPFCWSNYIDVADPTCSFEGFSVGTNGFGSPYLEPCGVNRSNYGLYDNLTIEEGRHNLSFGIDAQHQDMSLPCDYPSLPIINFSGQYTNSGLADFLLGDISSFLQGAGDNGSFYGWQIGFYGEDQFQFRPNLTFDAGLRWEPNFPIQVTDGRGATFVPGQQSTVYPNAPTGLVFPGDKGIGNGLMRTTYGYWQPRVGVAWQPHAMPHTSFHAGFGLFTLPMILSAIDHTNENSPFAPSFTLNGTATTPIPLNHPWSVFPGTGGRSPFPPFASAVSKPPSSVTFTPGLAIADAVDPGWKLGVTQAWNLSAEQQIGANLMVRIAYVGSESYHQSVVIDKNPGIYATGGTRSTYPAFGQILYTTSPGTASYNGLQVTVERHLSHSLQFQSNFTWSKLLDEATSANIAFLYTLPNPFNLRFNRGISNANVPFIWVTNFIYTSPLLSGHNQLIRQTLGGWEVSAIITSESGTPFSVNGGFGNNNSESLQYEDFANRVPGQPLNVRKGPRSHWLNNYFNINAFTENPPGTFGNSGRNIMRGPPLNYTDAGLDKNWAIYKSYVLQFRAELFNAFNHPSFGPPNATNQIGPNGSNVGGTEGVITSLGYEPPRIAQFALKVTF